MNLNNNGRDDDKDGDGITNYQEQDISRIIVEGDFGDDDYVRYIRNDWTMHEPVYFGGTGKIYSRRLCNPIISDTDEDGLPDGWEYYKDTYVDEHICYDYTENGGQYNKVHYVFDLLNTDLPTEYTLDQSYKFQDDFNYEISNLIDLIKGDSNRLGFLTLSGWEDYGGEYGDLPSLEEIADQQGREFHMEAQNYLKTALQPGGKDLLFLMMAATPSVSLGTLVLLAEGYWALSFMESAFDFYYEVTAYRNAMNIVSDEHDYGGYYHQTRLGFERISDDISNANNESYARFLLTRYLRKLEVINSMYFFENKIGEIQEFNNNLDYYFGSEISITEDINIQFKMDGETITVVENGIDTDGIPDGHPDDKGQELVRIKVVDDGYAQFKNNKGELTRGIQLRHLEASYLLIAEHISTSFGSVINNVGNIQDWGMYEEVKVWEVAQELTSMYYSLYLQMHFSRLFIENLGNY